MDATQQTAIWIYRDGYPIGRTGSLSEADTIAAKEFENHPQSDVTIEKQTLTKQVLRTYKPFPKPKNRY